MRFGYSETCLAHDPGPRHPESPDRLLAIRETLERTHGPSFETPDPADASVIGSIHSPAYIESIEVFCAEGGGHLDSDTVASERTWEAARTSAGIATWAARTARPAHEPEEIPFALGRPPGHHALADEAMGFCIFNNAAVAAQAAIDDGDAETVAIFDWDVHHGNGTQAIFASRVNVAYASIHEEGLYPGTGAIDEIGTGAGAGATLNVPLRSGANTASYRYAFDEAVAPWVRERAPDLFLISSGFDAHRHDPISRMAIDTEGFGLLTARVLALAAETGARLAFILEGGYGLDTLSDGVAMVHEVCAGYEPTAPDDDPRAVDRTAVAAVRERHGLGS